MTLSKLPLAVTVMFICSAANVEIASDPSYFSRSSQRPLSRRTILEGLHKRFNEASLMFTGYKSG